MLSHLDQIGGYLLAKLSWKKVFFATALLLLNSIMPRLLTELSEVNQTTSIAWSTMFVHFQSFNSCSQELGLKIFTASPRDLDRHIELGVISILLTTKPTTPGEGAHTDVKEHWGENHPLRHMIFKWVLLDNSTPLGNPLSPSMKTIATVRKSPLSLWQGGKSTHHGWPYWMPLSGLKATEALTCFNPDAPRGHLWEQLAPSILWLGWVLDFG